MRRCSHVAAVLYGERVFDRFSPGATRVVTNAEHEARELHHAEIGTEHLLLGIVADGQSLAGRSLVASGATLAGCRSKVAEAVVRSAGGTAPGTLPFSDRANRALQRAGRLSLRRH